ncbi:hypothetical protein L1887_34559 [Cichorium endivia]|nr:hypothetical protein L1887_34559 [Cichorium endivia]
MVIAPCCSGSRDIGLVWLRDGALTHKYKDTVGIWMEHVSRRKGIFFSHNRIIAWLYIPQSPRPTPLKISLLSFSSTNNQISTFHT